MCVAGGWREGEKEAWLGGTKHSCNEADYVEGLMRGLISN